MAFPKSSRSTVKRSPARGRYDEETIYRILDAGLFCHVGIIQDDYPLVIPTMYGRKENILYIHGATKSRLLNEAEKQIDISVTVTLMDGLVFSRSAFDHSANYRSVMIFGKASKVPENQKEEALRVIFEHSMPGRWDEVRSPNKKELKATSIIAITINEASAKIRSGPPKDQPKDLDLPVWAGVLPVKTVIGKPIPDPELNSNTPVSESIKSYDEKRFDP